MPPRTKKAKASAATPSESAKYVLPIMSGTERPFYSPGTPLMLVVDFPSCPPSPSPSPSMTPSATTPVLSSQPVDSSPTLSGPASPGARTIPLAGPAPSTPLPIRGIGLPFRRTAAAFATFAPEAFEQTALKIWIHQIPKSLGLEGLFALFPSEVASFILTGPAKQPATSPLEATDADDPACLDKGDLCGTDLLQVGAPSNVVLNPAGVYFRLFSNSPLTEEHCSAVISLPTSDLALALARHLESLRHTVPEAAELIVSLSSHRLTPVPSFCRPSVEQPGGIPLREAQPPSERFLEYAARRAAQATPLNRQAF
ncbi:hypothetical protein H696_05582 [Fonticula alba]|uniref:Uncharacterized protein n=1 Tax=Fonticula alba TaxID=691883 RepID=A0A058Z135_FONAL|nr:hypothetical protein H696_05582 [Fonticula alba]KCV67851.1 hypothetical protein H696_05582 [Fonticula alba]|eukprot:XP_009497671.1 hypothetical protein H696_05582 [Fonticula alba]